MSRADLANSLCSVARAIERVGEPWTLMILREMFLGARRFDVLQRNTGASPHSLSVRLKQLCADGIVRTRLYSDHPPRREYTLTDKGQALWPVIIALKTWGDDWLCDDQAPAIQLTHKGCGAVTVPRMVCSECGMPMTAQDCVPHLGPAFAATRHAHGKKS